jgi:hypothetical protein
MKVVGQAVSTGLHAVLSIAQKIVGTITDAILAIPRAVAAALNALTHLNDHAPITAPQGFNYGSAPRAHAEGGWVGLNGPEIGMLGEHGPEYVVPNHRLADMQASPAKGVTIVGITEREIVDMVDRGLYFKLQRAAPTGQRV